MNDRAEASNILRESVVTIFVNSVAGRGRARSYLGRIQKLFESFQIHAQFVMTNSTAELESSAQNAISQGRRTLFAMGGDGTFQALVNAALGADALLGVLPIGGGNDFAVALGLPGDPVKAAEAILRGKPRFVDLVRVRTAEGRTRMYAGGGGIGLDAEAVRYASGAYRLASRPIALYRVSATSAAAIRAHRSPHRLSGERSPSVRSESIACGSAEFADVRCRGQTRSSCDPR